MTRSFDVFVDLRPNKRLSKQPWGWWFETQTRSLWRHCNVIYEFKMQGLHVFLSASDCYLWTWFEGYKMRSIYQFHNNVVMCNSYPIRKNLRILHYNDVIMSAMVSQITGDLMVCSTVCSGASKRKHNSSASMAFVRGIHLCPVNSPRKGTLTRKMFPFDDVIMIYHHGSVIKDADAGNQRIVPL